MYRLNCNLSDDLATRLGEYCDRTGISRVTVVTLALNQYLMQEEVKLKLMDELTNPSKMAEVYKALGVAVPGPTE